YFDIQIKTFLSIPYFGTYYPRIYRSPPLWTIALQEHYTMAVLSIAAFVGITASVLHYIIRRSTIRKELKTPTVLLSDILWDVLDDPATARRIDKDGSFKDVDFSQILFGPDVTLEVSDRWRDRSMTIPVYDGTIQGVFGAIHDFYLKAQTQYDQTHDEDADYLCTDETDFEKYGWYIGHRSRFEELYCRDPLRWEVDLGS
ncbi:hypothetical protein F5Y16DRAFT_421874, partial [Xylariaceae sp. FL0255]